MAELKGLQDLPMYFGAEPEILRLAGELRNHSTKAEKILWQQIRGKKILGYKFRRQHAVDQFILDFFCYEALLAIEVDGEVHNESYQAERDEERSKLLNRFGIHVLRFTNQQVENNIDQVLQEIKNALQEYS
ncbi:MAG: endonuclease domain-containing protein [Bacteroidales bacterium]